MVPAVELIEAKRDGAKHAEADIAALVGGYVAGAVPDYQMAAWLMAAFLRGLDADETVWLTRAMVGSGTTLDLSGVPGVKVDKHSTGGVGDTVTLVVAPVVAAWGAKGPTVSRRSIRHTGGAWDQLGMVAGCEAHPF